MSGPTDGRRRPTAVEAWLEERIPPYGFGLVLLLLIATYVVMASNPPQQWARILTVTLEGVTLLAALVAARSRRALFRVATLVVLLAILGAIASLAVSSTADTTGWFFALNVLLVGAAPVAIGHALYRRVVVDIRTVLGSICIYLLIGFMYAFAYAAIGTIGSQPFFVQVRESKPVGLSLLLVRHTDHRRLRRLHRGSQLWPHPGDIGGTRSASSTS